MWARLVCAWKLESGRDALKRGDIGKAERCLRESLSVAEARGWTGIEEKALASLFVVLSRQGPAPERERHARRLIELRERSLGVEHRLVLEARVALVSALQDREAWEEADAVLRRDLPAIERAWGSREIALAGALFFMARGCVRLGRFAEAVDFARRALAVAQDCAGQDDDRTLRIVDTLAEALTFAGQPAMAEPLRRKMVADIERRFGTAHPQLAAQLLELSSVCFCLHRYTEAIELSQRALVIREAGGTREQVAAALYVLSNCLDGAGELEKSEIQARAALAMMKLAFPSESPEVAGVMARVAALCLRRGNVADARWLLQQAVPILERTDGSGELYAPACHDLATAHLNRGAPKEAEPWFHRALAVAGAASSPEARSLGRHLEGLGMCLAALGRKAEAEQHYLHAIQLVESAGGATNEVVGLKVGLALLWISLDRRAEASKLYTDALSLARSLLLSQYDGLTEAMERLEDLARADGVVRVWRLEKALKELRAKEALVSADAGLYDLAVRVLAAAMGKQAVEFERLEGILNVIEDRRGRPTSS